MINVHTIAVGQAREQPQQLREKAQEIRQRAQELRERAEARREQMEDQREARQEAEEAAREAREAAQDAAREARREVRVVVPPIPPQPGQEIIVHPRRGPWDERGIPGEMVDIVGMLTFGTAAVLILRPLMRAFANRFERRGAAPTAALPVEVTAHMERLEQAIEAVAIEVERISEGQRYTTKLLSERAVERR